MAAPSPTSRSLKLLRDDEYTAQVVEYWNSFARIRVDLFNVIDIVAVRPGECLGVQTTTYSNMGARRKKILASEKAHMWLQAGCLLHIHGWKKTKPNAWSRHRWECRTQVITLEDYA